MSISHLKSQKSHLLKIRKLFYLPVVLLCQHNDMCRIFWTLQLEVRKRAQIFKSSIQIGCLEQTWGIFCINTPEVLKKVPISSIQVGCLEQTWGIFCINTPEVLKKVHKSSIQVGCLEQTCSMFYINSECTVKKLKFPGCTELHENHTTVTVQCAAHVTVKCVVHVYSVQHM